MPDKKISQLTAGGASQAGDEYPIARAGANFKITGADIAAAATSVGTLTSLAVTGNVTLGGDVVLSRGAANRLDLASGDNLNVVSGSYQIGGTSVLSSTTLGSGVTASSLTSVGTLTSLTVSGNTIVGAEVFRGADNSYLRLAGGNPAATGGQLLMFGSTHATAPGRTVLQAQGTGYLQLSTFAGSVVLDASGNLAVDTNTLYVDAANNRVGVGTASPGYALDVVGGSATALRISGNSAVTNNTAMRFYGLNAAADLWAIGNAVSTNDATRNFDIYDLVAGANRLRLDASGNLGLGVTPSAWTTLRAFQNQRSAFASYSDGSPNAATYVTANAFYDGSWKYIASIGAALYEQGTSSGGTHVWSVAPSGTAGNAITFTQAMTLNASGNLGIGTTSPGSRLHVLGSSGAVSRTSVGANANQVYHQIDNSVNGLEAGVFAAGNAYLASTGAYALALFTNGTERARITSGGDVGIGTASPKLNTNGGTFLTVSSSTASNAGWLEVQGNASSTGDPCGNVSFNNSNRVGSDKRIAQIAGLRGSAAGSGDLIFVTWNADVGAERARIDASGNLLVNRTSAFRGGRLVVASTNFTQTSNNGNVHFLTTDTQAADVGASLGLGGQVGGDEVAFGYVSGRKENGTSGNYAGYLAFATINGGASCAERARIDSVGRLGIGTTSPSYQVHSQNPSSGDQNMFMFSIGGGFSNGVFADWISSTFNVRFRIANLPTTASAANAFLDSGDQNRLYRSTSSIRYKTDIESIETQYSDAVLNLRPVWYRSIAGEDKRDWSWYGLIAEEVAEIEPRLVHWTYLEEDYDNTVDESGVIQKTPKPDAKMVPDGVQYDRIPVLLLDVVKRQAAKIEEMEARLAALEA